MIIYITSRYIKLVRTGSVVGSVCHGTEGSGVGMKDSPRFRGGVMRLIPRSHTDVPTRFLITIRHHLRDSALFFFGLISRTPPVA